MSTKDVIGMIEREELPKNMALPIVEVLGIEHKFCHKCRTYLTLDKFNVGRNYCRECESQYYSLYCKLAKEKEPEARPAPAELPRMACRSYSRQATRNNVNIGYCMRWRKSVDGKTGTCGFWRDNEKRHFANVIKHE